MESSTSANARMCSFFTTSRRPSLHGTAVSAQQVTIGSATHSLGIHSLVHSPTHSLTHPITHPIKHARTHTYTHPLAHPPNPSPNHPFAHSLTQSLTHLVSRPKPLLILDGPHFTSPRKNPLSPLRSCRPIPRGMYSAMACSDTHTHTHTHIHTHTHNHNHTRTHGRRAHKDHPPVNKTPATINKQHQIRQPNADSNPANTNRTTNTSTSQPATNNQSISYSVCDSRFQSKIVAAVKYHLGSDVRTFQSEESISLDFAIIDKEHASAHFLLTLSLSHSLYLTKSITYTLNY